MAEKWRDPHRTVGASRGKPPPLPLVYHTNGEKDSKTFLTGAFLAWEAGKGKCMLNHWEGEAGEDFSHTPT